MAVKQFSIRSRHDRAAGILAQQPKAGHRWLPPINDPLIDNPFNKVLLLSLGSVPFWLVLVAVNNPPPPSTGQLVNTALVALLYGICATTLFLFARSKSKTGNELAAVDATQSSEVIFAIIGEVVLIGAPLPGAAAVTGILLVFNGLGLYIRFQEAGT